MEENEQLDGELQDTVDGEMPQLPGSYPQAPRVFNDRQKQIFRKVVRSKPWDWFDAGNMPLLIAYCQTIYHLEKVELEIEKVYDETLGFDLRSYKSLVSIRTQLQGKMADYATRMRLTQQSIYDERTAAGKSKAAGTGTEEEGKPWETPAQPPARSRLN